ncbi:hypothetical protein [Methanoculleus frigidifontis]|uniref:hypothetical protein n=1 Tax=Methanoculleus frigidifontis TaxID=2584085 RepID=UPI0026590C4B|nr:hypothetical protein [Methanoculleus sp. FWC-SCC1]
MPDRDALVFSPSHEDAGDVVFLTRDEAAACRADPEKWQGPAGPERSGDEAAVACARAGERQSI